MTACDRDKQASVFVNLLKACCSDRALGRGRDVHQEIIKIGLDREPYFGNWLMKMYGSCRKPEEARSVFDKLSWKNKYSWNIMLTAYAHNGHLAEAQEFFSRTPDPSVVACNVMINMYGQHGQLQQAKELFDRMPHRDTASWNSIISAFTQNGHYREAVTSYRYSFLRGFKPDSVTFLSILDACGKIRALREGREIEKNIIEAGYDANLKVATALVNFYGSCQSLEDARDVFEKIPDKDVILWTAMVWMYAQNGHLHKSEKLFKQMPRKDTVSWTAMIGAYAHNGHPRDALRMFREMVVEGCDPTPVTFITVLDACADIPSIAVGRTIHSSITEGFETDPSVENSLLHMYGSCGSLNEAKLVFDRLQNRNVVSWSSIISTNARNGCGKQALELYHSMHLDGVLPAEITLISVLHACCNAGLAADAPRYFRSMSSDLGLVPNSYHYICMIDILSRSGELEDAIDLVANMPFEPNEVAWTILLNACKIHRDVEKAKQFHTMVLKLKEGLDAAYVLLANSHTG